MEIPQMLDFVIRGIGSGAAGLGLYGTYRIKRAIRKKYENVIKESGLLEASGMTLDEVDIQRALKIITLSEIPKGINHVVPWLNDCAEELDNLGKAYSSFVRESEVCPERARDGFYRSLGVIIYIDKRYIGNKTFNWGRCRESDFNKL